MTADQPDAGPAELPAALLEVVKKIGLTVPIEALPPAIADEAARLPRSRWRAWPIEGDHPVLAGCGRGALPPLADRLLSRGAWGRVPLEGEPVVADRNGVLRSGGAHRYSARTVHDAPACRRVAERAIGVLNVLGRRTFTDEDRKPRGLAGQVVSWSSMRGSGGLPPSTLSACALADLGRLLSDTLDPDVVGQRAVDSICALLSANSAALYRLDPESGSLHELARSRDTVPPFEWTPFLRPGVGIAGVAVRLRAPVTSPDGLVDSRLAYTPEMRARVDRSPYRAFMGVPLLAKGRILGALAVAARVGRIFPTRSAPAQSRRPDRPGARERAPFGRRRGAARSGTSGGLARTINASRDFA
jgi:hypothetical protein